MTSNILLESGINELEIVVFKVGDSIFAVNVAKVDSILNALPVTKIPQAHRNIKGLINYRNKV
ncbi:MAG: chemotaxis protein CheV, partial [Clostridiales bacterium]|nr:chemotaxis protein CheV [Clostridiales bacterium]